jgi:AcrR family transcriptional regulator
VTDTRRKLVDGAIEALRIHGIAGTSARTIAASAGVNQALVFYYFGTMDGLLDAACRESTAERVALYRERFAAVASLRELLALGRELHAAEREAGNVAVLAQVLAGAQQDEGLAAAVTASFIGIELYEGVDAESATAAIEALEQLALLAEVVDDLGPVARLALRTRLRRGS